MDGAASDAGARCAVATAATATKDSMLLHTVVSLTRCVGIHRVCVVDNSPARNAPYAQAMP